MEKEFKFLGELTTFLIYLFILFFLMQINYQQLTPIKTSNASTYIYMYTTVQKFGVSIFFFFYFNRV